MRIVVILEELLGVILELGGGDLCCLRFKNGASRLVCCVNYCLGLLISGVVSDDFSARLGI